MTTARGTPMEPTVNLMTFYSHHAFCKNMLTESIKICEEPMTATIHSGDTQKNQKDTEWHFVLIVQILPRDPPAGEDQVPLQR